MLSEGYKGRPREWRGQDFESELRRARRAVNNRSYSIIDRATRREVARVVMALGEEAIDFDKAWAKGWKVMFIGKW